MNSVLLSAARTPIGSFMGALASLSAPKLGAIAIRAAIERAGVPKESIDEVFMGNVLTAGVGQAPARQAAIFAGIPNSAPCTTINKVCGSGLKAVQLADLTIRAGDANLIVAGGQESMSSAPYLLQKARAGYRLGNGEIVDSMVNDGLWDVYNKYHMGMAGELCAESCNFSREAQDEFAVESYRRALAAAENGWFDAEIVPVEISDKKGSSVITKDEEPLKANFDKFGSLKPAFKEGGTITAANASSINDGAAALVIASEEYAASQGLKPLARIIAHNSHAQAPELFTTAPAAAIAKILKRVGMTVGDIDLFEVNEAFSVVAMHSMREIGIPPEKLNVCGGAVSLGHPIGASGARILTTLLHSLLRLGKKRGLATLCIGGGEANAVIIETI